MFRLHQNTVSAAEVEGVMDKLSNCGIGKKATRHQATPPRQARKLNPLPQFELHQLKRPADFDLQALIVATQKLQTLRKSLLWT